MRENKEVKVFQNVLAHRAAEILRGRQVEYLDGKLEMDFLVVLLISSAFWHLQFAKKKNILIFVCCCACSQSQFQIWSRAVLKTGR